MHPVALVRRWHGDWAEDGYRVAGVYCRSQEEMASLAASCGVIPIAADLAQTETLPRLAETVLEQLGQVDVLVNNAACSYINLFQCMPPEQVRRLYAVNLTAVVELSRLLLPSMISRHTGCIVNISSMWGETGASCEVDYSVTKGAVLAFTRALAKEVGPSGIRVNAVSPGDDRHGYGRPSAPGDPGRTGQRKHLWDGWENRRMWRMRYAFWCPTGRRISPDRISR